ncbi:DnaJ domain-containing protein, partial [Nodularia spumigena]|uniref:DnaJ domain-containing protein n=1 Tax=Nodularia spumigena TaxID=70799 RepID=UPI002B20AD96
MLGLTRGATPDQIRAAYRRLARAVHPDVSKAPDAAARFAALADAYEQLTDPKRPRPLPTPEPDAEHAEAVYDAFFRAEAAAHAAPRAPNQPPPP